MKSNVAFISLGMGEKVVVGAVYLVIDTEDISIFIIDNRVCKSE